MYDENEQDGTNPEQGAQSATMDPMSIVRDALAYGRRQMGLPEEFYRPVTPSFDDGGMVPDPQGDTQQDAGQQMPDPRVAMKYLTGDGAVAPDIVNALEQQVDPGGAMDPSERMMQVLQRTPSPDAAFGVMQHYRTKFNAYSGAARAAIGQGDLAHAAGYATQAFANLPTGHSVQFAPANGGLAMVTRPHGKRTGGAPTGPSFGQGGTVDSSNPQNSSDEEDAQGFDEGGVVGDDDPYANMPESNNIEDRRGENGEGFVPKQDGPTPEGAGAAQKESHKQYRDDQDRRAATERGQGVVRKQASFDDGGEVDEGMIPDGPDSEPDADADDNIVTGSTPASGPPPAVLSPQDIEELLTSGYDKIIEQAAAPAAGPAEPPLPTPQQPNPPPPVDNGKLGNVFGPMFRGDFQGAGEGLMTNMRRRIRPASAGPSGELPPDAGSQEPGNPGAPQPASAAPAQSTPEPNYDDLPAATGKPRGYTPQESPKDQSRHPKTRRSVGPPPARDDDPDQDINDMRVPTTNPRLAEKGGPGGYNQYRLQSPGERTRAEGRERDRQSDPEQQAIDKYRRVANQMFPWVSQEQQRNNYIQQRMAADGIQSGKMEIEREHTKRGVQVAKIGATSREGIATQRVEHQDARALQKNMSDQTRAAMKEVVSRWNHTERTEAQLIGQKLMADPSYMGSPEHKQRENELRAKTNMSAQDIQNAVIAMIPNQGGGQAAPAPQGAAPAQGGTPQYKVRPDGKLIMKLPGGGWTDAPGM